jgi:hypothetical protein
MALKISGSPVVDDNKNATFQSVSISGSGASYLKVPVYATSAARDAAITVPTAGMVVQTGLIYMGYTGSIWDNLAGDAGVKADEALVLGLMAL